MPSKKILYATDYSESSKAALPFAVALARQIGATLLIAHVSEREQFPVGELFDEEREPDQDELRELNAVVPADSGVRCEHHLLYGEPGSAEVTKPADVLVEFAKKKHVEAIVLGTHGRSGVAHLLMGSVAEAVLRHASCPVISIRQPGLK